MELGILITRNYELIRSFVRSISSNP